MRLFSTAVMALVLVGFGRGGAVAQTVELPNLAPTTDDWFAAPLNSVRPIEIQNVAPASVPDITDPGPDMGDFPNSAFTLPKGRAYVESAPMTYAGSDKNSAAAYNWPFLLRYGVTDDVEFRLFGNGGTNVYDPQPVAGFSPLILDTKIHLWDGNQRLIPAASFEGYLVTNWGSPAFQGGWQPSLNMNFDLPVNDKLNFEWTIGYSGVRDAVNVRTMQRFIPRHQHLAQNVHVAGINVYQFSAQWAIEYQVTERVQFFLHGYYAGAVLLQQGSGNVVGGGGFYTFTKRLMGFGSCNAGLDAAVAPLSGQVGLAWAM